ncbi:DNA-binding protein [Aurantimonas endophytica]|uniref:DNA-binding protein n=1 Tax=Aurantimonas endophytica TaxID=1522175 RepID=A0A7W6HDY6_9HYPH|nr:DNA-binding protein [Aurantimonas endophytica]MBB4003237.1 hypothetical protein [Aurantimonas endophytica]MCO6404099.1 DNA-binding protein [Aurantimonas endophytica]
MTEKKDGDLGLVWGVEAIAEKIGRTPRQTFHMCATGALPAKKVCGRWVAKRDALERFFEEAAA